MLIFFITTGLPWSSFWGPNFSWAASKITPNEAPSYWEWEGPSSPIPKAGAVDRAGNEIPWATREDAVPASSGGGHEGHGPSHGGSEAPADGPPAEPASLDLVAQAMDEEGMEAGATIWMPVDGTDEAGQPVYGSYIVFNPWPGRLSTQAGLYVDQFSGTTLAVSTADTWGGLQTASEFGIQSHMGTQFGVVSRILATAMCLLVFWNIFTAFKMWNRRRRKGTVGIPRRPVDVHMQRAVGIGALVLALVYPLWGVTLLLVLAFDRFVVRRVPTLRTAFGMRS